MSVRLTNASDVLGVQLSSALTVGTTAGSLGCWFRRKGDLDLGGAILGLADAPSASATKHWRISTASDGTTITSDIDSETPPTGYASSADVWYWCVASRDGGGNHRIRVFLEDGTKVHDASQSESSNMTDLDYIALGKLRSNGVNGEVSNAKVHLGVEWSDVECIVEMRKFGIQKSGGTDRYCFRLDDTTDTFDGLYSMPDQEYTGPVVALSNTGGTDGAARPSSLEPLGLRIRQYKHAPETDGTTATTRAATFDAPVLTGSTIDCVTSYGGGGGTDWPSSFTDGTNTYAEDTAARYWNSTNNQYHAAGRAVNVTGGSAYTVTVNYAASQSYRQLCIVEVAGCAASPLDDSDFQNNASTTTPSTPAVQPTVAGTLILSSFKDYSNSAIGVSAYEAGARNYPEANSANTGVPDFAMQSYRRMVAHAYTCSLTLGAARDTMAYARIYKPLTAVGEFDRFNRADEDPLSDSGAWASDSSWGDLQLASNLVDTPGSGEGTMIRDGAAESLDDQWAAIILGDDAPHDVMPTLRSQGNASFFGVSTYESGNNSFIRFNSTSYNSLGGVPGSDAAPDDEIYAEVYSLEGNTTTVFAVWYNGVFRGAVESTTGPHTGGDPGIFVYEQYGKVASWAGGGLWPSEGGGSVTGSGSSEVAPASANGAGVVLNPVTGSGSSSVALQSANGAGEETIPGSGASEIAPQSASGAGSVANPVTGAGSSQIAPESANGAGQVVSVIGSGASQIVPESANGAGEERFEGSGASQIAVEGASGTGVVANPVTGAGASEIAPESANGAGEVTASGVYGNGASVIALQSASGAGLETIPGAGASEITPQSANGAGLTWQDVTGSGASQVTLRSANGAGIGGELAESPGGGPRPRRFIPVELPSPRTERPKAKTRKSRRVTLPEIPPEAITGSGASVVQFVSGPAAGSVMLVGAGKSELTLQSRGRGTSTSPVDMTADDMEVIQMASALFNLT